MQIRLDTSQWDRALTALGKKNAIKAGIRAINRTLTSSRSAVTKLVAADMGLPQKVVRAQLTVVAAKHHGEAPYGVLRADTQQVPLIQFKARQTKSGVKAKLPSGRGTYPHAFIRTTRSGHTGVFQRVGTARLPIYQLHGPSPFKAFQKHADVAHARALDTLDKNFQHELTYLLSQAKQ